MLVLVFEGIFSFWLKREIKVGVEDVGRVVPSWPLLKRRTKVRKPTVQQPNTVT